MTTDAPRVQTSDAAAPILEAYLRAARASWPSLAVNDADFLTFIMAHSRRGAALPHAHAGDLLLAYACAQAEAQALAAFTQTYVPVVRRVLSRRSSDAALIQDVQQQVLTKLLVASEPGAPPKIADYRGNGSLKSWVSMAAATSLLMAQRTQGRRRETGSHDEHDDPVIENVLADQPELNYLKQHYRAPVQAAIVAALEALPDRDRVLLRLHLSEGMSIDRLGAMYAVNRATAARWLAAARRTLLQSARAGIQKALRVSDTECDSILKLVRSQLDLSITAHLRSR